jgi:hypothetical protein
MLFLGQIYSIKGHRCVKTRESLGLQKLDRVTLLRQEMYQITSMASFLLHKDSLLLQSK